MKFKQQEETVKDNPFLKNVIDLLSLNKAFQYAIYCYKNGAYRGCYGKHLIDDWNLLIKLAISLNPAHKEPTFDITLSPVDSVSDLKEFEEKYYNALKEIGKNALDANEIEVVSYISNIIINFKHFFCTLNENDNSRETSS